ncbi:MAG: N-acetylmuramoyl-L-alanine amidase [Opitutales bacterium]
MARLTVTRWFLLLTAGAGLAVAQAPAPAPAPVRVPPTRPSAPQLWPVTRLRQTDWIDVRDIAARFGLTAAWSRSEQAMTLSDARGVRLVFETRQRDFHLDGLRIFLGEPVLGEKGTLWVTKLDVIKLVAPLLRPADRLEQLPVAAPRTIVLDPGHGGNDPGKENRRLGVNEKTCTLDVALRLKPRLEALGWRVLLTRTEDRELAAGKKSDLQLRDDFANRNQADLFLSIHFNSVEHDAGRVTGVEVYTMTPQFMNSAGEERVDDMTNVAYPGNRFDYASLLFGAQLHRAMHATLQTPDRGFKRGRLAVLRMLDCPGALVECAYLSNDAEARRVATPEFREKIAQALAEGVQAYAAQLAALRGTPVAPPAPKPAAPATATPQPAGPVPGR